LKIHPFKIPKPENEAIVYQEDFESVFYDKLHQHEEIQISLIINGEGTLVIGDSVNRYKPGDIFTIGRNLPHVFKSDRVESTNSFMMSLFFSEKSFGHSFFELNEFSALQTFFKKSIFGLKLISNKIALKTLFLKLKKASKLERFILLFEILHLINESENKRLSSFVYYKNYSALEGKRMSAIYEYTMNHFNNSISLLQIADVANMTTNAFCKYFKKRTNKTYFKFLNELRIEHAIKLLQSNSDASIAEIAYQAGFKNISNFNRHFKAIKHSSPSNFKKIINL